MSALAPDVGSLTFVSFGGEVIYILQAGEDGPVKIGRTAGNRLWARIAELQTGQHEHLRLLMIGAGGAAVESALHREFADRRLRGEWFEPSVLAGLQARISVHQWAAQTAASGVAGAFGLRARYLVGARLVATEALTLAETREVLARQSATVRATERDHDNLSLAFAAVINLWVQNPDWWFGQALDAVVREAARTA